jgi:hypothetical protein
MDVRTIKHHIRPGKLDEFDRLWMEVMWRHGLTPAPPPVSA